MTDESKFVLSVTLCVCFFSSNLIDDKAKVYNNNKSSHNFCERADDVIRRHWNFDRTKTSKKGKEIRKFWTESNTIFIYKCTYHLPKITVDCE